MYKNTDIFLLKIVTVEVLEPTWNLDFSKVVFISELIFIEDEWNQDSK